MGAVLKRSAMSKVVNAASDTIPTSRITRKNSKGRDESMFQEYAKSINMFRRLNRDDPSQQKFVKNSISGELFIQTKNILFSVPIPSIDFSMDAIPAIDVMENREQIIICKHEFEQTQQQVRSGDEMITIYEICKKCHFCKAT